MRRHVVLVGLPGAGKTTVGRLVAQRLGCAFTDLDAIIVRRAQMPVPRIFGEFGESGFRRFEREAMEQAMAQEPGVVAPGGGWAAQPGNLEAVAGRAFVVYLRCLLATAAKRTDRDANRPLLVGTDPVARMKELLAVREPFYLRADAEVRNDPPRAPAQVADEVAQLARERAGWQVQ